MPTQNGSHHKDNLFNELGLLTDILRSVNVAATGVEEFKRGATKLKTKTVWGNDAITKGIVVLSSGYTSGGGATGKTLAITGPTFLNNFRIAEDEVLVPREGATLEFTVTAINAAQTSATVDLTRGSDRNLAAGTELQIIGYADFGSSFGGTEPAATASMISNYVSNIKKDFKIQEPLESGLIAQTIKEGTERSELEKYIPSLMGALEWAFWNETKAEGTGAPDAEDLKFAAGADSRAGGLTTLLSANNGTVVTSATTFSERLLDDLLLDIGELGGLNESGKFQDTKNVKVQMWGNRRTINEINQYHKFDRPAEMAVSGSKTAAMQGSAGAGFQLSNGQVIPKVTDGLPYGHLVLLPRPQDIKMFFGRFMRRGKPRSDGDNFLVQYATSHTVQFKNPHFGVHLKAVNTL